MICYQMVNPSKSFSLEEVSIRWWWWILYSSSWEGQPKSGKDQQWGHKGNNPGLFCFLSSVGIWKVSNMNVKKIVSINSTVSRTTYQTICPPYTVHQQKTCSQQEQTSESTLAGVSLDRVDALKRQNEALKGQAVIETSEATSHLYNYRSDAKIYVDCFFIWFVPTKKVLCWHYSSSCQISSAKSCHWMFWLHRHLCL